MQDDIFARGEADRWFERNRERLGSTPDTLTDLVRSAGITPRSIIELGAANGYRVAGLARTFGCRAMAVDLSAEAIADGRRRYPEVEFLHAPITGVPTVDCFDLVIVNFVLHWIDRRNLMRSVAEIDRLVADGGCLALGDFLPDNRTRTVYGHLPPGEVWTYKQDYPSVFCASGLYRVLAAAAGGHGTQVPSPGVPAGERVGFSLLEKSLQACYSHV